MDNATAARKTWDEYAKKRGVLTIEEFLQHAKTVRDIGAWTLTTSHAEARKEIRQILFKRFPEILNPTEDDDVDQT